MFANTGNGKVGSSEAMVDLTRNKVTKSRARIMRNGMVFSDGAVLRMGDPEYLFVSIDVDNGLIRLTPREHRAPRGAQVVSVRNHIKAVADRQVMGAIFDMLGDVEGEYELHWVREVGSAIIDVGTSSRELEDMELNFTEVWPAISAESRNTGFVSLYPYKIYITARIAQNLGDANTVRVSIDDREKVAFLSQKGYGRRYRLYKDRDVRGRYIHDKTLAIQFAIYGGEKIYGDGKAKPSRVLSRFEAKWVDKYQVVVVDLQDKLIEPPYSKPVVATEEELEAELAEIAA